MGRASMPCEGLRVWGERGVQDGGVKWRVGWCHILDGWTGFEWSPVALVLLRAMS